MREHKEMLVKMVLDGWHTKILQVNTLLTELSDEALLQEISPGRSRGIYLLGHLTAAHDKLFFILNICSPIFPVYEKLFVEHSDGDIKELPAIEELRQSWLNVTIQLTKCFSQMHSNEWFQRHALISEAGFAKEPHRNKLNVLLSGTNHLCYHLGQMILLKDRGKATDF